MEPMIEGLANRSFRGTRRSVVQPSEIIPDETDDLIGFLAAKLRRASGWSSEKEKMLKHLENLLVVHGYKSNWLDYRDYQLIKVGQSYRYHVPIDKRGFLAQFADQKIRLVCVRSGIFRQLVYAGGVL